MSPAELSEILYTALGSPLGVEVSTNRPDLLRQRLYKVRAADPALASLSIHISPTNPAGALFIVNRSNHNVQQGGAA